MVDYAAAIKKPFKDIQTLILGIVISAIPIINFLTIGYLIGLGRDTLTGKNTMPKWDPDKIIQYLKDFVFGAIIYVIYMIPAGIVFLIAGISAFSQLLSGSDMGGAIMGAIIAGGIFGLLAGILLLIAELFLSMGILSYAKENSIGKAFQLGKIVKKLLTPTYWIAIIILAIYSTVVSVIAGIISGIILFIPVIGLLLAPFTWIGIMVFIAGSTSMTILAQVYKETP